MNGAGKIRDIGATHRQLTNVQQHRLDRFQPFKTVIHVFPQCDALRKYSSLAAAGPATSAALWYPGVPRRFTAQSARRAEVALDPFIGAGRGELEVRFH